MADKRPLTALTEWREKSNLTQEALGKELGVWNITISRWETGERKIAASLLPLVSRKTGLPKTALRPDLAELLEAAE